MRAIVGSFFAALCLYLLVTYGIDPGIGHAVIDAFTDIAHNFTAILSAHPLEAVAVLGTAFPIDQLDRVMTLKEWRALRRISASTERRLRAAGLGPKITYLTQSLIGVRVRDDLQWLEAGGASGALAQRCKAYLLLKCPG